MPSPPPLLERYRALLAEPDDERFPISLGEGGTPLVHARRLGEELGLERLFLKFEGTNPTGSFKDRGMVLAVNRAVARGAAAVVCASTGNTSASAAAYAAAERMSDQRNALQREGLHERCQVCSVIVDCRTGSSTKQSCGWLRRCSTPIRGLAPASACA